MIRIASRRVTRDSLDKTISARRRREGAPSLVNASRASGPSKRLRYIVDCIATLAKLRSESSESKNFGSERTIE
jgi:hypothetical protein